MTKLIQLTVDCPGGSITKTFRGPVRIGRELGSDCRVDAPSVSRQHAEIDVTEGRLVLRDVGSRHGTFLYEGTRRLQPDSWVELENVGNAFEVGGFVFRAELVEGDVDDGDLARTLHRIGRNPTTTYADAQVDPADVDAVATLAQLRLVCRHRRAELERMVIDALGSMTMERRVDVVSVLATEFTELSTLMPTAR